VAYGVREIVTGDPEAITALSGTDLSIIALCPSSLSAVQRGHPVATSLRSEAVPDAVRLHAELSELREFPK
jgi:hypothetical protein